MCFSINAEFFRNPQYSLINGFSFVQSESVHLIQSELNYIGPACSALSTSDTVPLMLWGFSAAQLPGEE